MYLYYCVSSLIDQSLIAQNFPFQFFLACYELRNWKAQRNQSVTHVLLMHSLSYLPIQPTNQKTSCMFIARIKQRQGKVFVVQRHQEFSKHPGNNRTKPVISLDVFHTLGLTLS